MRIMNLFLKFIKQYLGTALLFAVFVVIFVFVFSLYSLETEAVSYAAMLCVFVAVIVTVIRFLRFRTEYHKREELLCHAEMLNEHLPEASSPEQEQWLAIISELNEQCRQADMKLRSERTDMFDYFTVLVHQIKIPISVMHMELDDADTPENRAISDELFRIEQYVEMVLCYFRLDGNSSDLVSEKVQIDEVIRAGLRKYAPIFIHKKLRLDYDGTRLTAVTDSKWLGFIIEQILSNAVKYTDSGKVTITVSDDRTVMISDTGIGIAAEDIPRIFERGYTGYNGRTQHKSTGLGLYLVKKACDRSGIHFEIRSKVGEGTSVLLRLPEMIKTE